jgi:hypothetical protein
LHRRPIQVGRLGARLLRALRTVGNPDQGGADNGKVVFLCIASARVNFRFCREECTTDPAADRESVVFDLARYGQRQSRMSVPGPRFDDAGKRPALRFIQLGRRVCPEAASLPRRPLESRHQLGGAPGPRDRGGPWRRPGGSEGGPAPGRWQSAHLFGKIPSFGGARSAAAQLRTHSPAGSG